MNQYLPLAFAVGGALVWGFASNKMSEAGKLTFLAGMIGLALRGLHL